MDNEVRCPHGIVCDFVYTYTYVQGEQLVTGGNYWHDEETRCDAGLSPDGEMMDPKELEAQRELDDDMLDYARSQWDGRPEGPRTEYDQ